MDLIFHFWQSGARTAVVTPDEDSIMFAEVGSVVKYDDPRFMHNDLDMLVANGFLSENYGATTRSFRLTRAGAELAENVKRTKT